MSLTREELCRVFESSRRKGTAVGIRLKGRETLLITTLEELGGSKHETVYIRVNRHSIYGEILTVNHFFLPDIEQVFTLRISFNDPFYTYLRSLRNNIRAIRRDAGMETSNALS